MLKKDFFAYLPDPLLSEKFLAFASYPDESNQGEAEITLKIARDIYNDIAYSPIYYDLEHSPTSLNLFICSRKFNFLKRELVSAIQYIKAWVVGKDILIDSGIGLIPAEFIFDSFLTRLISDAFSDHRTLLYSDGKKNIEVIAVLLREPRISLEFRKKIIITLLSDDGLTLCSGGCLARLSEAAENLKNYGVFTPCGLIKAFITGIAKETTLRKMAFRQYSYSQLLCLTANVLVEDYEIHAMHYLLTRLRSDLGLHFLVIPSDPHIESFKLYLKDKESDVGAIYINYLAEFKRQISASNLIKFISYQIYEQALPHLGKNYYALKAFIEVELEKLGEDPEFSLAEVFSEEGILKKADSFAITIAERLLNSKWLAVHRTLSNIYQSYFFPANQCEITSCFRLYLSNIALSWVKLEGRRKAVIELIAERNGLNRLNGKIFLYAINLKFLLQCAKDVYIFFKNLPVSEHESALKHIASVNFDMYSVLKDKLTESIYFQAFYKLIMILSQKGRRALVSYYPELVRSAIFDAMDKIDSMDDTRLANQVALFITAVINAGFINFTGILFKRSKLDFSGTYLKCIDFSYVNLLNAAFDEAIWGCNFSNANLAGATFKSISLTDVKFAGAYLINSSFKGSSLKKITFVKANLKEANFKNTTLTNLDFKHANLVNSNFSHSNLKKIGFRKANLESTSFECTDLADIDFREAHLEKTNFSLTELKEVYCLDAWLLDSNFEAAQFYFANFRGALLNSANFYGAEILEKIDFTNAQLQAANLSGVELSRLDLTNADLTDANLTTTQRIELYKQGIVNPPAEIKSETALFDSPANQTIEIADTGYRWGAATKFSA